MQNDKLKAIFKSGKTFDILDSDSLRILEEKGENFIVEYQDTIYRINVSEFNPQNKQYRIIVNNKPVELTIKNKLDQLIDELGLKSQKEENVTQILAPMPGLVIDTKVKVGDNVDKGDAILILEAMKMENVIKSKGAGIVKSIHVAVNDKVEKAQLMIEFE